jgi:hypothetical protein
VDLTNATPQERSAILDANHGPSIYDQIYSHSGASCSLKDYETLVSLIAGGDKKDKLVNGVIKPKKSSGLSSFMNSGTNPYKRQFVNGARRKNLMGESCSSLSESEASASDSVAPAATDANRKQKLSPNGSGRKPLSYLFELSDSSVDGKAGDSTVAAVAKGGGTDKISNKINKGRSRTLKQTQKTSKKSSSSDSDELELPVPKSIGGNAKKSEAPIYSDSDSDDATGRQASPTLATKAAVKEFTRKSNKKEASAGALPTKAPPKAKVKGPGRKKKGFKPTELIVPQREAAKKATESIRSVKPKKEAGSEPSVNEPVTTPLSPTTRLKERDVSSDRSGDGKKILDKEKVKKPKNGEKAKSPGRKGAAKAKASSVKAGSQPPDDDILQMNASDSRDQYDFDGSNDGSSTSKNVTSYVPQRQAAKKAAEHIRSGLSNIVAARLIIEDEMEAARKKTKGEKPVAVKKPQSEASALISNILSGKKSNKLKGKSSPIPDELSHDSAAEKISDDPSRTRDKKRTLSKGNQGLLCSIHLSLSLNHSKYSHYSSEILRNWFRTGLWYCKDSSSTTLFVN